MSPPAPSRVSSLALALLLAGLVGLVRLGSSLFLPPAPAMLPSLPLPDRVLPLVRLCHPQPSRLFLEELVAHATRVLPLPGEKTARLLPPLFATLASLPLYASACLLWGPAAGAYALLGYAFLPAGCGARASSLPDALFLFLLATFLALVLWGLQRPVFFLLSSFFLPLLFLTRPEGALLLGFPPLLLLLHRAPWPNRAAAIAGWLLPLALLLGCCWMIQSFPPPPVPMAPDSDTTPLPQVTPPPVFSFLPALLDSLPLPFVVLILLSFLIPSPLPGTFSVKAAWFFFPLLLLSRYGSEAQQHPLGPLAAASAWSLPAFFLLGSVGNGYHQIVSRLLPPDAGSRGRVLFPALLLLLVFGPPIYSLLRILP